MFALLEELDNQSGNVSCGMRAAVRGANLDGVDLYPEGLRGKMASSYILYLLP
jgi:hypothetical protein